MEDVMHYAETELEKHEDWIDDLYEKLKRVDKRLDLLELGSVCKGTLDGSDDLYQKLKRVEKRLDDVYEKLERMEKLVVKLQD